MCGGGRKRKKTHHGHALLTMLLLGTINPHGIRTPHGDCKRAIRFAHPDGHKAAVDAVRARLAGGVVGAGDDGVVHGVEVEFERGAYGRGEDVGLEDETAGGRADGYALGGAAGQGAGGVERGRRHRHGGDAGCGRRGGRLRGAEAGEEERKKKCGGQLHGGLLLLLLLSLSWCS